MLGFGVYPPSNEVMKGFYDQIVEVLLNSKKGIWRAVTLDNNLCVGITGPVGDLKLGFYDFDDSQDIGFSVNVEGTVTMSTGSNCPSPEVILQRMELLLSRVKQLHTPEPAGYSLKLDSLPRMTGVKALYEQIMEKVNWKETDDSQRFWIEESLCVTLKDNKGDVEFVVWDNRGGHGHMFSIIGQGYYAVYTPSLESTSESIINVLETFLAFLTAKEG